MRYGMPLLLKVSVCIGMLQFLSSLDVFYQAFLGRVCLYFVRLTYWTYIESPYSELICLYLLPDISQVILS